MIWNSALARLCVSEPDCSHATDGQVSLAPIAVLSAAAPNVVVPSVAIPNVARSVAIPSVATPNVATPNVATPNVAIPKAARSVAIPSVATPNVARSVATPNVAIPNARVVRELLRAVQFVVVARHNAAPAFPFAAPVPDGTELRFFLAVRADVSRPHSEVQRVVLWVLLDHPDLAWPDEPPGHSLDQQTAWQQHPQVFARAAVRLLHY
jgi:hypothetical protein